VFDLFSASLLVILFDFLLVLLRSYIFVQFVGITYALLSDNNLHMVFLQMISVADAYHNY